MNPVLIDRLNSYLSSGVPDEYPELLQALTYLFYSIESDQTDLYELVFLPAEHLLALTKKFGGRTLKIPTTRKYQETHTMAVLYYLRIHKRMDWSDIDKLIQIPLEMKNKVIAMGNKALKMDEKLQACLKALMGKLDEQKPN